MKLAISQYISELYQSGKADKIARHGVERSKKSIYDWVHKAEYDTPYDREIEEVALNETVVKIDGNQFWLYTAVDQETNHPAHAAVCGENCLLDRVISRGAP